MDRLKKKISSLIIISCSPKTLEYQTECDCMFPKVQQCYDHVCKCLYLEKSFLNVIIKAFLLN